MTGISWNQYGVISKIVAGVQSKTLQFGKTSLEKFIYLLQEAYGVDCGYTFELYTYGPFSSDILMDLDPMPFGNSRHDFLTSY
jgi:uncharacterized protein YwgA